MRDNKHDRTQPSAHYVVETVTIAIEDVDIATMRVGVGISSMRGMCGICEVIDVGDVTCEVRVYCKWIERKYGARL